MSIEPAAALIGAIADVSESMLRLASALRAEPDVDRAGTSETIRREERTGVESYTVGKGSGARVEWFTSAEFANGVGVSFTVCLQWHDGEWTVEGGVTAVDTKGELDVIELPTRYAADAEGAIAELSGQTRLLDESWTRVVQLVRTRNLR